jgi:hypothetical protein
MDIKQIRLLLPKNSKDIDAANEIIKLGAEILKPIAPDMLRVMKNFESPVTAVFCEFFAKHGEAYVDDVVSMLRRKSMPEAKHAILTQILPFWSKESVEKCHGSLIVFVQGPQEDMFFNNDIHSLQILLSHQLGDPNWALGWLNFKIEQTNKRSQLGELLKNKFNADASR